MFQERRSASMSPFASNWEFEIVQSWGEGNPLRTIISYNNMSCLCLFYAMHKNVQSFAILSQIEVFAWVKAAQLKMALFVLHYWNCAIQR